SQALLAQVVFDLDSQLQGVADNPRGLTRTKVRARNDPLRLEQLPYSLGRLPSLSAAEFGDRRIGSGGEAADSVSVALTVTNQNQLAHRVITSTATLIIPGRFICQRAEGYRFVSPDSWLALASALNGSNRSIGSGKMVVELCSEAISARVCK